MRKLYKQCRLTILSIRLRHIGLALIILLSNQVLEAQYNVTDQTDGNATNQLRGAIHAADVAGGTSTISVAAGTYNLTMGEISFGNRAQNITITGAGAALTIINMTSTMRDRIFLINPPGTIANVQTTISGITFKGGFLTSDAYGGGAIICGGSNNSATISNCIFDGNSASGGGGALQMNGGGTLNLNLCTFTNNTCLAGAGGAIYYFLPNRPNGIDLSGSLLVTNCLFNGNSVTENSSIGGAIHVAAQGTSGLSTTFVVSIQKNTFTANHADAANSSGGAISITNSFSNANTAQVNYNRFAGNTAANGSTSALAMTVTQGSVDASNNWWGCNDGPSVCSDKAALLGAPVGGTLTTSPRLRLTVTASPASICTGNTSLATASFLTNSTPAAVSLSNLTALIGLPITYNAALGSLSGGQTTVQASGTATVTYTSNGTAGAGSVNAVVDNVPTSDATAKSAITVNAGPSISANPTTIASSCAGNNVSFSVTATGGTSYQWYKGATAMTNGATGTGSTITGATTATLSITNASTSDNATNYNVVVSGATCSATSGNASLTVSALAIPGATSTATTSVSASNTNINNASCMRVAKVVPSGGVPVSGNVTANVTVDGTQPSYNGQPYLKRHYDISPVTAPNTATATITLYFLQSEFDDYNAAMPGTSSDLPTSSADAVGKGNLRITQFHGTGTSPGNYSGWAGVGPAAVLITPGAANVVWNSAQNLWEVTFSVTGFSGFYATGLINFVLPVKLESFTGSRQGNNAQLNWLISEETNVSRYEVEQSNDGINFSTVKSITSINNRNYSALCDLSDAGPNYYRLKIIDTDGKISYSDVVVIDAINRLSLIHISPNPFADRILVSIDAIKQSNATLIVTDINGKMLLQQKTLLSRGANTISINQLNRLVKGTYILRVVSNDLNKTVKIIKSK